MTEVEPGQYIFYEEDFNILSDIIKKQGKLTHEDFDRIIEQRKTTPVKLTMMEKYQKSIPLQIVGALGGYALGSMVGFKIVNYYNYKKLKKDIENTFKNKIILRNNAKENFDELKDILINITTRIDIQHRSHALTKSEAKSLLCFTFDCFCDFISKENYTITPTPTERGMFKYGLSAFYDTVKRKGNFAGDYERDYMDFIFSLFRECNTDQRLEKILTGKGEMSKYEETVKKFFKPQQEEEKEEKSIISR